jgi:thiamine-phosphate pyrophosphorylase
VTRAARPPFGLYVILDPAVSGGRDLVTLADAVLRAGGRWIQLRDKTATTAALARLARVVGDRVRAAGGVFIVNDRVDVALAVGADGAHLGQDDLPLPEARRAAPGLVLGASTHSLEQALAAQAQGADYVALGSVFPTGSKAGFELSSIETLRLVRSRIRVPLVAIGGITLERIGPVLEAGADGVAVISAVGLAPDPEAATAALVEAVSRRRRLDSPRATAHNDSHLRGDSR